MVWQNGRLLARHEIPQVWTIDRSETIHGFYQVVHGVLQFKPGFELVAGWPDGEAAQYTPILQVCYDRGGWFYALFDQDLMIAVVVLDALFIGMHKNLLQLKFLHVGQQYRGQGLGQYLFELACQQSLRRGASGLYISATPTENTIKFYLALGCQLCTQPDQTLFELEPEDIHMQYILDS